MGCLPVPLIALIGFAIGYLIDGRTGSVWGGGVGLLVGLVLAVILLRAMRRANRR
jgi:F0F1-type ATP synthase assembly protein I